jgi:hypothetical protein
MTWLSSEQQFEERREIDRADKSISSTLTEPAISAYREKAKSRSSRAGHVRGVLEFVGNALASFDPATDEVGPDTNDYFAGSRERI